MEHGQLERLMEYRHFEPKNDVRLAIPSVADVEVATFGEKIIAFGNGRVVYFWQMKQATGELASVVVPGFLVKERYRQDKDGNVYSLVKPVSEEQKPALEASIWFEFARNFGNFHHDLKFDYCSDSGTA